METEKERERERDRKREREIDASCISGCCVFDTLDPELSHKDSTSHKAVTIITQASPFPVS